MQCILNQVDKSYMTDGRILGNTFDYLHARGITFILSDFFEISEPYANIVSGIIYGSYGSL
jgi:hypothetical protein